MPQHGSQHGMPCDDSDLATPLRSSLHGTATPAAPLQPISHHPTASPGTAAPPVESRGAGRTTPSPGSAREASLSIACIPQRSGLRARLALVRSGGGDTACRCCAAHPPRVHIHIHGSPPPPEFHLLHMMLPHCCVLVGCRGQGRWCGARPMMHFGGRGGRCSGRGPQEQGQRPHSLAAAWLCCADTRLCCAPLHSLPAGNPPDHPRQRGPSGVGGCRAPSRAAAQGPAPGQFGPFPSLAFLHAVPALLRVRQVGAPPVAACAGGPALAWLLVHCATRFPWHPWLFDAHVRAMGGSNRGGGMRAPCPHEAGKAASRAVEWAGATVLQAMAQSCRPRAEAGPPLLNG